MTQQDRPVWLITGCSTGFGRALAKAVLAPGYRAAVTARDREQVVDIANGHTDRALVAQLDVTDRRRVTETVRQVEAALESIDVLVNNAGIGAARRNMRANSGGQPGDPVRAAVAIVEAVEAANPPLHLLLGKDAVSSREPSSIYCVEISIPGNRSQWAPTFRKACDLWRAGRCA